MRALVLGATGFLGGSIVRALVESGHSPVAFSRRKGDYLALRGLEVEMAYGDLSEPDSLERAIREHHIEVLFHAAGFYPANSRDPLAAIRLGVESVRLVCDVVRKTDIERLVFTSSFSTLARPTDGRDLSDERDYYRPGSFRHPYPEAKYAMEVEVWRYIAQGLRAVVVLPGAVFGPGDVKPTSGMTVQAVARGIVPAYIGGRMSVIDCRDMARAQVRAGEVGRLGERYILGGSNVGASELMRTIAEEAGVAAPRLRLPSRLVYGGAVLAEKVSGLIPGDPVGYLSTGVQQLMRDIAVDSTKAQRELGLTSRPLRETIHDTLVWFRENGYL